jgi:outer membrane protein OmpA-like peptidoglycan-associated protein
MEHDGVASARLAAEGYGPKDPVATNSTDDGKAQNRRVALLVIKK